MGLSERRQREREGRRRAIVIAAARVFARRGIEAASMDAIASEAELGKATLYYYFETKSELSRAVVEEASEQLFAELQSAPAADRLPEAVEGLLHAFARFAERSPDLLAVVAPFLATMHLSWSADPPRMPPDGAHGHRSFLARLDRLAAASNWSGHVEALYDLLGDVLVVLAQLFLARSPEQALSRIPFYVDLVRRWTPEVTS